MAKRLEQLGAEDTITKKVEDIYKLMLSKNESGTVNRIRELAKEIKIIFESQSFQPAQVDNIKFYRKLSEAMVAVYAQSIGTNALMNKKVKIEKILYEAESFCGHSSKEAGYLEKVSSLIAKLMKDREDPFS